jgi:DNA-binding CsgD family transcriptional regulator
MDHLVVVASAEGVPEGVLQSLRLSGWKTTVTTDVVSAKQLLRNGNVAGLMVALKADHDPERLKILRFVHEFCPNTMVVMLHSGMSAVADFDGPKLVQTLDTLGNSHPLQDRPASVDLHHLSPAQRRIAELVAQGYPNKEIARQLKIKEQSVRNELSRIFKKMGIWNRVELALLLSSGERSAREASNEPWGTRLQSPLPASDVHESAAI